MSPVKRAWLIGVLLVMAAVAKDGRTVARWDGPALFGAIYTASLTAIAVLTKSPHDAAADDAKGK